MNVMQKVQPDPWNSQQKRPTIPKKAKGTTLAARSNSSAKAKKENIPTWPRPVRDGLAGDFQKPLAFWFRVLLEKDKAFRMYIRLNITKIYQKANLVRQNPSKSTQNMPKKQTRTFQKVKNKKQKIDLVCRQNMPGLFSAHEGSGSGIAATYWMSSSRSQGLSGSTVATGGGSLGVVSTSVFSLGRDWATFGWRLLRGVKTPPHRSFSKPRWKVESQMLKHVETIGGLLLGCWHFHIIFYEF